MGVSLQFNNRGLSLKIDLKAIQINFSFLHRPNAEIVGIQSITKDGRHAVFLDYDNMFIDDIIDDIRRLQRVYRLFPFMLFISSIKDENQGIVNAHAVSLSKRTFEEVAEIQRHSHCDWNYRAFNLYRSPYRAWVLRLSPKIVGREVVKPKPDFVGFVGDIKYYDGGELSHAHYKAFKSIYPEISVPKRANFDKYNHVKINKYKDRVRI